MLTLTETIDAIKSLDTPFDVIEQACKKVVEKDKKKTTDKIEIMLEIMETYENRIPIHEFVEIAARLSAHVAAIAVAPGKEAEMLATILGITREVYVETLSRKYMIMMKTDPERAIESLMNMLENIANRGPKV
jgi:hypothetical protein